MRDHVDHDVGNLFAIFRVECETPFMHQEIFACFKFRWTGTMRNFFFVFTMLQIREHKKQHLKYYIYKQSHGSAEIRSLYHVVTACQNQELLLAIYK